MKLPRRVYATDPDSGTASFWRSLITKHQAVVLKNGENSSDYPDKPVAYETLNFGWILSAPDADGQRHILMKY